jgi:predicted DNA binding CopG/RHH family protein
MPRKLPVAKTDAKAAAFVEDSDLTAYDLSGMRTMRFEFAPKEARINMRLPGKLLTAIKAAATRAGVPYQRFIRQALEEALTPRRSPYRGKKTPTEHLRAERDSR